MDKSPDAFRTISEVAEYLDTPAHVLRFWESRFPQIRPVKRAGGRRYYRPSDVALLTGIKRLLHDEGMTIRGVQKILREHGVRHVAGLSGQPYIEESEGDAEAALEQALALNFGSADKDEPIAPDEAASATVVALETALRRQEPAPAAAVQPLWPEAPTPEPAPASDQLEPDPEAPFIEVEEEPLTAQIESHSFAPVPDLLSRLRALPALALADQPKAQELLHRLQALQHRMHAAPEPRLHSQ